MNEQEANKSEGCKTPVACLSEEELAEQLTPAEEQFHPNAMQTSAQQRLQRKNEILTMLKMEDLKRELQLAIAYVIRGAHTLLSKEQQDTLFSDIKKIRDYTTDLSKVDLEALLHFSHAAGISPETIEVIDELTVVSYEKGDFIDSAAVATLFCLLQISTARPWLLRGLACQGLEQHDKAVMAFTIVIKLLPDEPYAYLYLAESLHAQGEKSLASQAVNAGLSKLAKEEKEWIAFAERLVSAIENS